jgi:hypothetical protein
MLSEYRIATVTATACLTEALHLQKLFDCITVPQALDHEFEVVFVELYAPGAAQRKGTYSKLLRRQRREARLRSNGQPQPQHFNKQVTVVMRHRADGYELNAKLFANGKVQMAGCKMPAQGLSVIGGITQLLRARCLDACIAAGTADTLVDHRDYQVVLINAWCHCVGIAALDRDRLFHEVLAACPDMVCVYDPNIYPAVKVAYFVNCHGDGVCRCRPHCSAVVQAKHRACCKVTIALFHSGAIILTGATTLRALDEAHRFACKVASWGGGA